MKALHSRTCAGLALTASYWSVPAAVSSQGNDPIVSAALAAEIAAEASALSVRCAHPAYLPRQRRRARRPRA